jgi:Fe-S cluster assembly scaffold protein SufB
MGIQSFLKAQKGDPDWVFTPEQYLDKEFKIIDANLIELRKDKTDSVILRQTPTERELLAKHLRIDIREGATLDLAIINEASDKLQQVFIYDIRVREGGHINMGLFVTGGKLNKHIIQVNLDDGANFNAYGHMINTVGGDCEIITKVNHDGAYSVSNQFFTCEAGKDSQTVFQGMAHITPEASYAQIGIENLNLITGKGGKCHSMPEVFNNCDSGRVSTGTSTEQLDVERTYYLQTRGLSHAAAEALMITKHREQVLNIILSAEIKEEISQLLIG